MWSVTLDTVHSIGPAFPVLVTTYDMSKPTEAQKRLDAY